MLRPFDPHAGVRLQLDLRHRSAGPVVAVAITLVLGACGGSGGGSTDGDQGRGGTSGREEGDNTKQIAHAINESFTSSNPDKCTAFNTQRYLEQTGLKGKAAVELCRRFAGVNNAESVRSSGVSVHDDTASANVTSTGGELGGQTIVIRLLREGNEWKLDQVTRFVSFDREAWNSAVPATLRGIGVSSRIIHCVVAHSKRLSDGEVQDLYLHDPSPYQQIIGGCAQKVRSRSFS